MTKDEKSLLQEMSDQLVKANDLIRRSNEIINKKESIIEKQREIIKKRDNQLETWDCKNIANELQRKSIE